MRSVLGALARLVVKLLPKSAALPILSGPLRGARWALHSSNLGCWLGVYESDNQRFLTMALRKGDTFVDVGAHVGFFTLLGAKCVGAGGTVYAFEPLNANLTWLRRNIEENRLSHVDVSSCALSDQPGRGAFGHAGSPSQARLDPQGDTIVEIETLDRALEARAVSKVRLVKLDVEGAEAQVLRGAERLLTSDERPAFLIATHGWRAHSDCLRILSDVGFDIETDHLDEASGNGTIRTLGVD